MLNFTCYYFPFRINVTGAAFLLMLTSPLELTFWNRVYDNQRLFLYCRNILETTPSQLPFHSGKREEITDGQIR